MARQLIVETANPKNFFRELAGLVARMPNMQGSGLSGWQDLGHSSAKAGR